MLREIIEDPDVETMIDHLCEHHARFKAAWDGLKWLLARTPEIGHNIGYGDGIRIHKQNCPYVHGLVSLTVLYEYDHTHVEIRAINVTYDE